MGLLDLASHNSFYRGLDYHHQHKVTHFKQIGKYQYQGEVMGSNDVTYDVVIDVDHPRKSTCNCPFAKDRRVICKHMVAMYFSIFPEIETVVMKEIEDAQNEYELERQREFEDKKAQIEKYVMGLSKKELQTLLINRMLEDIEDEYEEY